MELINHTAEAYSKKYSSALDGLLSDIEDHTQTHHAHAQMLSGHVQGKFLEMISAMIQPEKILEIGTFVGFSAVCLARGLKDGGKLFTLELREEDAVTARENFKKAGIEDKVELLVGNAREIIPTLQHAWDLVFIDADKTAYIDYYELTLPQLKPGGFIIADNVLFHGEVLEEEIKGKNAKAIDAFNRHVAADDRTEKVILTVRDGVMLIRKK